MSETEDVIRVMLIDDHRHVHEAVRVALQDEPDIQLVAQGGTGEEALQLCATHQPHIILMDVVMPQMDGIDATRIIHDQYPDVKILVLSSFQDDESVHAMLQSGAIGYVLKNALANELGATLRAVHAGQSVFSTPVANRLFNPNLTKSQAVFNLTEREMEVLKLVTEGLNNGEIAAALTISRSTVKFHLQNILSKMQVETRAEAIVLAAKNNLV